MSDSGRVLVVRIAEDGQSQAQAFKLDGVDLDVVTAFFEQLRPLQPRSIGLVRIVTAAINLRADATTSAADLGDTVRGTLWEVFEERGPWVRVGRNVWLKTGQGLAEWVERYADHQA